MPTDTLLIFGAGGHGRVVADGPRDQILQAANKPINKEQGVA